MKLNQILSCLLLAGAITFTSCDQGDTQLKSNVSSAVNNDEVNVDVKDGVVTLKGEVEDAAEKARAEAQARDVKGVHEVNNEIVVILPSSPPVPSPEEAVDNAMSAADAKLNAEVQAVLTTFPDVQATVNNGVVTLTGEVTRAGEILLMPKIKGLFPRKIENKLTIK